MATAALRSLHVSTPSEVPPRIVASAALADWLVKGGPAPVSQPRKPDAPPLLHLSDAFEIKGSESNITLVAKRPVAAGHFVVGVAMHSVLHPRAEAANPARRKLVAELANKVRAWRTGGDGLLGEADDAYRIDLILLLTLELLDGARSRWAPYLASLPKVSDAAPPSLWSYLVGGNEAATCEVVLPLLRETWLRPHLLTDDVELSPLLRTDAAGGAPAGDARAAQGRAVLAALAESVPGTSVARARETLLRALALVASRMISGVGMVPLLDLCNGAIAGGGHNATIERTQLAASQEAPETAPCVAALTSRPIAAGEEVLLSYGSVTAGSFLGKYGYVTGGPDAPSPTDSPHELACLLPRGLWPSLTATQRQASAGKTTPMMRQVGLIASLTDEATLQDILRTGKLGTSHGVGAPEIARQIVSWCGEHAAVLATRLLEPKLLEAAVASAKVRMGMRVGLGARAALLSWMDALVQKHSLDGAARATRDEAAAKQKLCVKKLKAAIKQAAEAPPPPPAGPGMDGGKSGAGVAAAAEAIIDVD